MSKYKVTIEQLVKQTAVIEVETADKKSAQLMAEQLWEEGKIYDWRDGDVDEYHSPSVEKIEEVGE